MYRFRWAACQLDELTRCTRRQKTLKYILESLPETLEATYDQILSRIAPADTSDAAKLLLWLSFAEKPLHIDYLAIVVEFDEAKEDFDPAAKLSSPEDVLRICSSLVTKMSDNTVQLAHASVKEYVLSEKPRMIQSNITINPSLGNSFVGKCCLGYLLCSTESVPICQNHAFSQTLHQRNTHKRFDQSLIRYAAKFWPKHISASKELCLIDQIKKLFIFDSFSFHNWVRIYNYDSYDLRMDGYSLLECASFHGLTSMVEWLLPHIVNNTEVLDALCASLNNGHTATTNVLIEKVMNLVACGMPVGNVLHAASSGGHEEIIKLMLKKGADVNAQGYYGNALQGASCKGHKEIVQLLIREGADVNSWRKGYTKSALHAASHSGNKDIVELLLERGANVTEQGGNALQAASAGGHKEVIELLLERGADVNMHEDYFENAVEAASLGGYKDIIELLVSNGREVNIQGKYAKALQGASFRGHRDTVELLLERGADVHAPGKVFGSALEAASTGGYKDIIELLLEKGADVNENGNALWVASYNGHKGAVWLLIKRGADVNEQGGQYGNALQAASAGVIEKKDIVELLLDRGANVNAQWVL